MYPNEKKHRRQQVRIPSEQCKEQAKKQEVLVPIRLDLEHDGYKIRDTFTWNKNETFITPEQFAEITCEDLRLPVLAMSPLIATSIREQIQDFDLQCTIEQKEKVNPYQHFIESRDQPPLSEPVHDKQVDFRTIIKLDIIVGNRVLHDQFEWDIACQQNSPESFAENMVTELGLGGEFKTAIAHSIREQVHIYLKSLLLIDHDMQTPVDHDELKRSFLPPLQNIVRRSQTVERFTPSLIELTEAEVDKIEKDRTRESRRKRRNTRNRKGVVALPEREHIPTFRTIFATPPEQDMTDEQFLKSMQTEPTLYHSQRKSAAKARQSIAAEAAGLPLIESDSVNPPSVPNTFVSPQWRCIDCGCSPYMTSLIRSSSLGENSLCNACSLYRFKFNAIRPKNYTDKEIKNDIPHLADWQNHLIKHR
ncbi:uncharacterized protein B0P05DRAFT_523936 [Gilbertella persicaria]|uniref:uncharacterized protein n=1 Tax=Gilbertella persicaria TaxID=101096 RepID=UPI00221FDDE3|nr:uncharacterized protein B0P05DRAFT_523936 [Gilbertella persicaria]KAI8094927.1 hypothetical protein B0P05DRAFT_523936 [Gilbertella persicaria]